MYSLKTRNSFVVSQYTKYEIPEAQKYQVRQTNVNHNCIIANKDVIESIIYMHNAGSFFLGHPVYIMMSSSTITSQKSRSNC